MKQSAVELLMESILGKDFRLTCSDEQLNAYQQAKQMEAEQSKIPELSDEEIEEIAEREYPIKKDMYRELWSENNALKKGMKLYREQLKQRQ